MTPTTPRAPLLVALLLTTAALTVFAPPAAAHACSAQDPSTQCGSCTDLIPHDHRYDNGTVYCKSTTLPPLGHCSSTTGCIYILRDVDGLPDRLLS